jgi:hypothetical protein
MANIERAIKAAIAKRGLEFSLKDETLYLCGTRPFVKCSRCFGRFANRLRAYYGKY